MAETETSNDIVEALMALAAERPWDAITLETLAERAGLTLAALRSSYEGRIAILADFVRGIDAAVLSGLDPALAGEAQRERLFDVLFARFEALAPHKPAIRNIGRAARRDPLLALELNRIVTTSMAWMLAAAGIPSTGGRGLARAQALAIVWARVLRVFLDDDDPGLARTMAALDKRLREAERAARRLDWLEGLMRRPHRSRRTREQEGSGDEASNEPSA